MQQSNIDKEPKALYIYIEYKTEFINPIINNNLTIKN